jgi:hypothetical protein
MMSLAKEEGLGLVMPALMVLCKVEHDRHPTVKEVREICPSIADEMGRLGFDEFTPSLYTAMVEKPLRNFTESPKILESIEIDNFIRGEHE